MSINGKTLVWITAITLGIMGSHFGISLNDPMLNEAMRDLYRFFAWLTG